MSGLEKALFNLKASSLSAYRARLPFSHIPFLPRLRILLLSSYVFANIYSSQFTAKQLNRQAAKASKDEKTEKDKLKKVRFNPSVPVDLEPC